MKYKIIFLISASFFVSKKIFSLSLEDIYADLNTHYSQYKGITYDEPSSQNFLMNDDWLLQTPNLWESNLAIYNQSFEAKNGQKTDKNFFVPTCQTQDDCSGAAICKEAPFSLTPTKLCLTKAYDFLETTYNAIVSAHDSVDIVTLALPASNKKAFRAMFKNSVIKLADNSIQMQKTIVIRILQGFLTTIGIENSKTFLTDIIKDLPSGNKLIISISDMRSCNLISGCKRSVGEKDLIYYFSWNHSKIVNIDNNVLIIGGENFFGEDYLGTNPVNDSNMKIEGVVAEGARRYANFLWEYVDKNRGISSNFCSTYENGVITNRCVTDISNEFDMSHPHPFKTFNESNPVKAMFVSKLDAGVLNADADQSEIARVYALENATKSIKISQQALYFSSTIPPSGYLHPKTTVDGNLIEAIVSAIYHKGVDVDIITSNFSNESFIGNFTGYSSFVDLNYIYDCFLNTLQRKFNLNVNEGMKILNEHLGLGYLGYYPMIFSKDPTIMRWHRSHNKFWMVDDKIFYFGSHNFYPSSLQEFGVIVESEQSAQYLLNNFWNPMWKDRVTLF